MAVDQDQFIHATAMTPGHEGEIHQLEGVVERSGPVEAIYADSAYSAARVRDWLAARGIADRIQRKGYRGHPLSRAERRHNAGIAEVRALVEPVFGTLKAAWAMARTRFLGLARNTCQWQLAAIAWNLAKGARFKHRYG